MNTALVTELEMNATRIHDHYQNRAYKFFIQKVKLKNLNGDHKHIGFLCLLHALTMIGYDVKISQSPQTLHLTSP
jgi:hypothetical protein